ncbi:MAG: 16S rRNA (uracil(1498)-N(3))-methyltransferase [Peptococcaceae bacterium]|nr:16S rRNA (uracil(1498)-N(3))-methyltransferase [Peptococcaceae bacterium]
MHRFKIQSKDERTFFVTGEELHHLVKVLRLRPGDKIKAFDNTGAEWLGIIEFISEDMASCRIIAEGYPEVEAKTNVYIAMGLAKGEKMEWVIQKGTELGMAGFVPLRTSRSVVQLDHKKAENRVKRWQKIASEAVKQARRVVEPKIFPVADWAELPEIFPANMQWLLPYEEEKNTLFSNILQEFDSNYPIGILIGPEGGFTPEEVAKTKELLNARSVSLGPRILRTETAALAALVMVLAFFGELG